MEKIRDEIGIIEIITDVKPKEIKWMKGLEEQKATVYEMGIKFQDKSWHNISASSEAKAREVLKILDSDKEFKVGDSVKIYEEDKKGKGFFYIKSITKVIPHNLDEITEGVPKGPIECEEVVKTNVEIKEDKVIDFKTKEADKFELGMAKNNAAVMMNVRYVITSEDQNLDDEYWSLVRRLYSQGKELRKEILGY